MKTTAFLSGPEKTLVKTRIADGYARGTCYLGDYCYQTLNPQRKPVKARKASPPEPPVSYGPFTILPVYSTHRPFTPPRKLGYIIAHDGQEWNTVLRTTADAKAYARLIAEAFAGMFAGIGCDEAVAA